MPTTGRGKVIRAINNAWQFTQIGGGNRDVVKEGEWLEVTEFPTTVHVELLKAKKIPDPFVGLHEWDVQWIGEAEWAFRTEFIATEAELATSAVDLVFDGLDTFASVLLNGKEILHTDNQFVAHRVSVKDVLKVGPNELLVNFTSAFRKGREIEKQHEKYNLWNGDSSRLHVRKAQYNYGWDWGPVLMTVGPWKPIYLETYQVRISDLDIRTKVSETLDAVVDVHISLSAAQPAVASVNINGPDGVLFVGQHSIRISESPIVANFALSAGTFELWYPVGYGKQPLYTAEIIIADEQGKVLDRKTEKFALRRALVVQDELIDQEGRTFLFEINNIRIFCGGSNWIPADSFLTTVTPERYRQWLQLMVDGNQNMVRVWGGGIYEADAFYDICDELGILVWQDFMFGCGQYPAYDSFLKSVEVEAEQNVKRLRHHPSVVIFAGNNEDYQVAESLNLELDYSDEQSDFRKTNFPARYIYERLLPSAVEKFSNIHYQRGSPYSGFGKPTTDKTYGDIHQWNVWHGSQEPWHNWDILAGRFVSEFGMQGYPNIRTVDYWVGDDTKERYPQSRTMNNHNKADGFERRLELYLMENFKHAFDIESYIYYTQIMQAETLASAYRLWRRNWKGRGKEYTAGALVWQVSRCDSVPSGPFWILILLLNPVLSTFDINDCWPVTSWAIVDYFLRPKPAYFTIKRELRTYTVGMTRKETKTFPDELSAATFEIETILEVWGTNSTLSEKKATLEVTSFDLHSDWIDKWSQDIVLAPNASTELWKGELPGQPKRTTLSEAPKTIVVSARLFDVDTGEVLGRYSNWPEPFKFVTFPNVKSLGLSVEVASDGESITLATKKPIKGIVLDVEGGDVQWGDQGIDLVPGDTQVIKAVGLKGREVKLRYLGDGTA
ncbi:glycoside hydrolase family 2 protein [Cristinia sonorae]|uniref:Beta-mannosidase B n=1 Tax=Cristinia sonorae TaxID=1940300 RepID=A0A8K0XTU7_9AGAR|nr:glycoside hydrolase family 2 protein [Cristinia sonorae]